MLGMELRKVPTDDAFRLRPGRNGARRREQSWSRPSGRPRSRVDPAPEDRGSLRGRREGGSTWTPPMPARRSLPRVPWAFDGDGAGRLDRRQSPQVAVHPGRLLGPLRDAGECASFSLVPEYLRTDRRGRVQPDGLRASLGRRFRSLKLWMVIRASGWRGCASASASTLRLAELFESWVRDEPGWELCAPPQFSLICFRREGSDEENEATARTGERGRRDLHLPHAAERPLRPQARPGQPAHDGRGRAASLGRST